MNSRDLRDAEQLWTVLETDKDARQVAKTVLASQLRTTGLESTLRWLDEKSKPLLEALCRQLDVPKDHTDRGKRSNLEVLADSRRALALAEALHLVAHNKVGGSSAPRARSGK